MKRSSIVAMGLLLSALPLTSVAELAVIVNPSLGLESLSQGDVSNIFLGKKKAFPNGKPAVVISVQADNPIKEEFDKKALKKNPNQMEAYWAQLVFTGRATPPDEFPDEATIKKLVADNPNMIGVISGSNVDASVKSVFSVP